MTYPARDAIRDALAILGTGMLSAGSYLIYEPMGLIVPGVLFVAASVWRA
ncbi:hypothetical protein [Algiphilus sp.]